MVAPQLMMGPSLKNCGGNVTKQEKLCHKTKQPLNAVVAKEPCSGQT
jgi:hypothetical protein